MCFRPPSAQKPVKCPQCGALNPPISKKCIKCKAELAKEKESESKTENKD
ncbi:hypothetical protein DesLBE_2816 [Desulfitobacterium sp. LBE]|uniref:NarG-like domain n=3 Tax=root TaxID=1 RepID=A0A098AVH9_DESHA|nr:hypothetical protein HMPREF0322_01160 [Desulfitobacterium hafniense DP7]TWH58488.1 hypothetical protein DesLBE_2816 [Desulfitobacterium sp. LBE]CDX00564.1 NarG-like domain [Desulfitobacterium hafniense]